MTLKEINLIHQENNCIQIEILIELILIISLIFYLMDSKCEQTIGMNLTNATDTYIYCAWAEAPTVDLFGGVPTHVNINN